jgi:hypothetical protein
MSIISYLATIYSLEFWTDRRWSQGELGGILDYKWFGTITIYHVLGNAFDRVFLSLDFTSYILVSLIAIDIITLRVNAPYWTRARKLIQSRIAVVVLCAISYAWTMISIDSWLRAWQPIGGVVLYVPFLGISVIHVYQGHPESLLEWAIPDYTMWLLILTLILTVLIIRRRTVSEASVTKI